MNYCLLIFTTAERQDGRTSQVEGQGRVATKPRKSFEVSDVFKRTLTAAELQARSEKDEEKFTDVQTIRERFGEKWIEVGFLPPSAIINRAMNKAG